MKRNKKLMKYYFSNIVIRNIETKQIHRCFDDIEAKNYLGMTNLSNCRRAIYNGKYKQFEISRDIVFNKDFNYEWHRQNEPTKKQVKTAVEVTKNEVFSLKQCFEALHLLEKNAKEYKFDSLADFVCWLEDNHFVENELR